jgi:perosamine synthetase
VCFSVPSAFELLLDALALEPGSEVLVSAVTHPDMPRIIERHELVPVPVDVDLATMAPEVAALELSVTERTRALLVAHLFGARFDMDPLVAFAKARGLLLWEDCAQALRRPDDPGDQRADVSLFSFGSIKTATALGGAVGYVRDPDVLGAMRDRQSAWPLQQRSDYVLRVLRFSALTGLGNPAVYGVAVAAARRRALDVDELVNGCVRALHPPSADDDQAFARWARRRPSPPLLALLASGSRPSTTSGSTGAPPAARLSRPCSRRSSSSPADRPTSGRIGSSRS